MSHDDLKPLIDSSSSQLTRDLLTRAREVVPSERARRAAHEAAQEALASLFQTVPDEADGMRASGIRKQARAHTGLRASWLPGVWLEGTRRWLLCLLAVGAIATGALFGFLAPSVAKPLSSVGDVLLQLLFWAVMLVVTPFNLSEGLTTLHTQGRLARGAGLAASLVGLGMFVASAIAALLHLGVGASVVSASANAPPVEGLAVSALGVALFAVVTAGLLKWGQPWRARWGAKVQGAASASMTCVVPLALFCQVAGTCSDGWAATWLALLRFKGLVLVTVLGLLLCAVLLGVACYILKGKRVVLPHLLAGVGTALATSSSQFAFLLVQDGMLRAGVSEGSAKTAIPFGVTMSKVGSALFITAATLSAQTDKRPLGLAEVAGLCLVSVVGAALVAGVPHASLAVVAWQQSLLSLPITSPSLLVLDLVLDRLRTAVNVTGDVALTLAMERFENGAPCGDEIDELCPPLKSGHASLLAVRSA